MLVASISEIVELTIPPLSLCFVQRDSGNRGSDGQFAHLYGDSPNLFLQATVVQRAMRRFKDR